MTISLEGRSYIREQAHLSKSKPPENHQKDGLFWALLFTMHLVAHYSKGKLEHHSPQKHYRSDKKFNFVFIHTASDSQSNPDNSYPRNPECEGSPRGGPSKTTRFIVLCESHPTPLQSRGWTQTLWIKGVWVVRDPASDFELAATWITAMLVSGTKTRGFSEGGGGSAESSVTSRKTSKYTGMWTQQYTWHSATTKRNSHFCKPPSKKPLSWFLIVAI